MISFDGQQRPLVITSLVRVITFENESETEYGLLVAFVSGLMVQVQVPVNC